ncbi:hypothetical protein LFT51_12715 [Mycobacterium intracellulare subsp. chimaera]|uniref:hypothetical protein n=1 Tax=Mycobacterium intracellulare TaxID=1767 RepID=UPI0006CA793F|nr:hypothetical protein [Mycobacterium intracellulare]ARV82041.1 hypothetical protein BWK49_12705 [Mycobacterium intracellulare subsp. chimaera]ASL09153.1 hypothetical protein MYCODSM44623_02422 [Mycobacterium intracellulare subsp. chimaera]ASL20968.1 hypothetical protein MYCOZU1_02545 [Mycobacterium intracellulare subsp. chimaera]KPN46073.1 hypothetical protein AN931_26245 [Mycobacterium intracellulare subsp. chimaera]KPN51813.1 hypothetical protein AN932_09290 [Mycobacterium intracellulare s
MSRRQIAAAAVYGIAVYALGFLMLVGSCAPANAAPEPPPTPPGYVECNGQLIPADPRLDVQNPLGAVMYRWFLQQMCAAGTPPPGAPPQPSQVTQ